MNYKISIEGQEIDMPEEIAGDDGALKSALSPYFPGAANAKFMRSEPKDGVITVTVVKQAGTKGATPSSIDVIIKRPSGKTETQSFLDENLPNGIEDQVLRNLIGAPKGINPVMALDNRLKGMPAMNQIGFEAMLKRDAEIGAIIEKGEIEVSNMARTHELLSETSAQPAPMVVPGF
jgi:hypothetical protein